jgi:glutamine amidotransferase
MTTVAILDYGIGNIQSISNAVEHIGAQALITRKENEILAADALILPGVGAFAKGMSNLNEFGLIDSIYKFVDSGKPFLGVCLGMQMLLEESEEFGTTKGLGLIKGKVVKIALPENSGYKLPHISWNAINKPSPARWNSTILEGISEGAKVYFVHTFMASPKEQDDILSITEYGGGNFCSAVQHENVYGTQFHPEKSAEIGLTVLKKFISLTNKI